MSFTDRSFAHKTLFVIGVGAAAVATLSLLAQIGQALLVLFAAVLVALVLRGFADWLSRRTPLSPRVAIALTLVGSAGVIGVALWAFTPRVIAELTELSGAMPRLLAGARTWLDSLGDGRLGAWVGDVGEFDALAHRLFQAAGAPLRGIVYAFTAILGGIYLAISPDLYRRGCVRLLPRGARATGEATLRAAGRMLQRFLLGRLVSMIAVGLATGVGLYLFAVPLPIALALIAGVLTFVPYVGPILSAVPIGLVALGVGPDTMVYVLLFYLVVQAIEGGVISPLVQARAVALPPVLMLFAELVMGILGGPLGIAVSVPLAALTVFLVRTLYVERLLEGAASPEGAPAPDAA